MHPPSKPSPRSEFLAGCQATFPLIVGAIPFGLIFGALAASSGLSWLGTVAMSAIVFAGASQFIALGLLATGTHWLIIVLTTFVVNLRHLLYSVALVPHVKSLPSRWKLPLGFWLTDETFAVVINRYNQPDDSPYKHWYHLGSALFMYSNWQLCTWLGLTVGRMLPDATTWGLDFAMSVTFIGMVIPYLINRPMLATSLVAGGVALATYSLPNKLGLILASLAGIGAGIGAERWSEAEPKRT
ncbi:AzlC family ABC transporter permease [Leptolyngbya sp. FACHB-261]|nr:AzlC family ABC transporter permease [Leptolyngbya sp. FACHB-261]